MNGLDDWPVFPDDVDWLAAQRDLATAELADGAIQVPPTEQRLAAMLEGVADPERSYGLVPPLFGDLTPVRVAYNCVLAGAPVGSLTPVLRAAEAALAPEFNLLGLLTTTGSPAVAFVLHGPVARGLGLNAGVDCLSGGANVAVGRALALVFRNIAGARPGVGDMATLGQPGKFSFCFAEAEDRPLPTLPERRGLAKDAGAVTVLGVSGTVEALPFDDRESGEAILAPIAAAMIATTAAAGSGRDRPPGEQAFILPPELAADLARHNWDLERIQRFLFEADRIETADGVIIARTRPIASAPEDILPIVAGGAGVKMACLPLWGGGTRTQTRAVEPLA